MKRIIASIKLAPGNRGYFDPLTGMNLSLSNNIGYIREGDNVDNIRRDIKNGKIKIVGGNLPPAVNIKQKQVKEEPVKVEVKKESKVIKKEIVEKKKEEIVKQIPKQEIKQEKKKPEKKAIPFVKEQPPVVKEEPKPEPEAITIDVKDKKKLEQASEPVKKDGE